MSVGEPLEAELLSGICGPGVLEASERRGLIVVDTSDRRLFVSLAHPLIGEVLRESVGVLARRVIFTRLADSLEASGVRRHGDLLRLATWRLDGGAPARGRVARTAVGHDRPRRSL